MLIGYARVSTADQQSHLQIDKLRDAGCEKLFEKTASGAATERPALKRAIEAARKGAKATSWLSGSSIAWPRRLPAESRLQLRCGGTAEHSQKRR